ncbi:MAG: hypothetical protein P1U32_08910 [Legionellaceae bacterium]|nr:hypothetical protein [Legionellaceae bacterium]
MAWLILQWSAVRYMKKVRYFILIALFTSCVQSVLATTVPLFVSVDATTLFTQIGRTEQVNLLNGFGNTYVPLKHWDNKTTVMFGVGATTYNKNHIQFNTGARYFSTTHMRVGGTVSSLNMPAFNNLAYNYRVKSDLVWAENAVSYTRAIVQPNIIVGLGYASNRASQYQVPPLYSQAAASVQTFTDNTTSQLMYEVGAGIDWLVLKPAVIELAYRFIGAGKAYLGYSPTQTTTDRLSTGDIYYQTISLGIRLYYDHTY